MWPILYGVSGMLPLGFSCACATPTAGMTDPADAVSAAPTLTLKVLRKSRRFTSPAMFVPPLGSLPWDGRLQCPRRLVYALTSGLTNVKARGQFVTYNRVARQFVPGKYDVETGWRSDRDGVAGHPCCGACPSDRLSYDLRGGPRTQRHSSPPRARRHAQAVDVLHLQPVAQEASRVRGLGRDAREEARLPVTGRALLVHGRRALWRARVGLRRRHDGRPALRGDGAPRGGVRHPLVLRAPAGPGLGLARLGDEERRRGRSVRERPRAFDRAVQRRRLRRARAARRRTRFHGSLERDAGRALDLVAHRGGGRAGPPQRGRRVPRLAARDQVPALVSRTRRLVKNPPARGAAGRRARAQGSPRPVPARGRRTPRPQMEPSRNG